MSTNTQLTSQFKVVSQAALRATMGVQKVALFDSDGNPLTVTELSDLTLADYVQGSDVGDLELTDTILEALAKLENRIVALVADVATNTADIATNTAAIADHETRITTLEA